MLLRRWERARHGEGQFVAIVGEPGLGKSRLIEEFHTRLADTPHSWVEWSSSQLLQNTPLHPIADWGRQRFGGAEVAPERRLADLESTLAQVKLDTVEYVPLLAPLVDIPLPPERASPLAPEELRLRQMAAISHGSLRARARSRSCSRSRTCTGPIRRRSIYCAASPNAARWRPCWSSRRRGRNFARHGARARIPGRSRSRPRSRQGRRDGRRTRLAPRSVAGNGRRGERAHRRRAFVRRGSNASPAWSGASRAARRRSRRRCSSRWPRGSTGSARRAKSR